MQPLCGCCCCCCCCCCLQALVHGVGGLDFPSLLERRVKHTCVEEDVRAVQALQSRGALPKLGMLDPRAPKLAPDTLGRVRTRGEYLCDYMLEDSDKVFVRRLSPPPPAAAAPTPDISRLNSPFLVLGQFNVNRCVPPSTYRKIWGTLLKLTKCDIMCSQKKKKKKAIFMGTHKSVETVAADVTQRNVTDEASSDESFALFKPCMMNYMELDTPPPADVVVYSATETGFAGKELHRAMDTGLATSAPVYVNREREREKERGREREREITRGKKDISERAVRARWLCLA